MLLKKVATKCNSVNNTVSTNKTKKGLRTFGRSDESKFESSTYKLPLPAAELPTLKIEWRFAPFSHRRTVRWSQATDPPPGTAHIHRHYCRTDTVSSFFFYYFVFFLCRCVVCLCDTLDFFLKKSFFRVCSLEVRNFMKFS